MRHGCAVGWAAGPARTGRVRRRHGRPALAVGGRLGQPGRRAGNTEAVSPLYGADTALWWTAGGTVTRGQYLGRRNHSALARFAQNTITRIDTTQMTRPSR